MFISLVFDESVTDGPTDQQTLVPFSILTIENFCLQMIKLAESKTFPIRMYKCIFCLRIRVNGNLVYLTLWAKITIFKARFFLFKPKRIPLLDGIKSWKSLK